MDNFSGFCPIWNFSDLQYFPFIHQKRVKDFYKKKHGQFSSILPYLKLFGIFFLYSSKACKTSFLFFLKSLHYFWKRTLLVQWKDVLKKNTWKIFQYSALFETFLTYNIFRYSWKACKTSFYFFLKACIIFEKKNAFGALERRL